MLSDYGDDEDDEYEYTWAHISFHGGDLIDNRKYVVGEKLATFLGLNVKSRHSIESLERMIMDYVDTHAGVMKRKYNFFLNFDSALWDALNLQYDTRIKRWEVPFKVRHCMSYPEPFRFERVMKAAAVWDF